MIEALRKMRVQIENAITRAVVDRAGDGPGRFLQLLWGGDRVSADVEHLEPQGVHFRAPAGASALLLSPGGSRAGVVAIGAGTDAPQDTLQDGEGGLHLLGTYKVFLAADGSLCLGAMAPNDKVPCDSKLQSELSRIKSDLSTLKSAIDAGFVAVGAGTAANGSTGKTAFDDALTLASWPSSPGTTASSKVKVQS